jgi:hypothetical protein
MAFSGAFIKPFRPAFDAGLAAAGNGLLNNLVAYWPMNEASGANDALDLHANGLTLTQTASPGSATGPVYAGARTFDGSTQYFSRASEASLQFGDSDFTVAAWIYNLQTPAAQKFCVSKYAQTGNQREWALWYAPIDRFRFYVSPDGISTASNVVANQFGAVGIGSWNLVVAYHDAANNTIGISVNAGSIDSLAHSTGVYSGSAEFVIGRVLPSTGPWYGRIGPVAIWKSAASAGGVLTTAQRTALYASGAGLAYAAFTT